MARIVFVGARAICVGVRRAGDRRGFFGGFRDYRALAGEVIGRCVRACRVCQGKLYGWIGRDGVM